jgi:FtsH-binding integral membrane protein
MDLSLISKKRLFIAQTYAIVVTLLAVCYLIIDRIRAYPKLSAMFCQLMVKLILLFVNIGLILCIWYFRDSLGMWGQLVILSIIAVLLSLTLQCFTGSYDTKTVDRIFIIAILVFIVTSILGYITILLGWKLGFMGMILLAALIAFIVVGFVFMFTLPSKKVQRIWYIIGVFLFSLYVVYDTNKMVMYNYETVVEAALGFFLDFVNLFANLLGASN